MLLNEVSTEMLILGILVFNLLLGLLYVKLERGRARRTAREAAAIQLAIKEYFRRSGVEVSVGCTSLDGKSHYTAFIESEPMKRFRLSHIIEATLSEYVQKTCGLELEKIYWRFPIKDATLSRAEAEQTAASDKATAPTGAAPTKPAVSDEYINEGLVHYKHLPQVEATEISWENFQELSTLAAKKGANPSTKA